MIKKNPHGNFLLSRAGHNYLSTLRKNFGVLRLAPKLIRAATLTPGPPLPAPD